MFGKFYYIRCFSFGGLDPNVYGIPNIALNGFFFYGDVQVVGFMRNEDCNSAGEETPLLKWVKNSNGEWEEIEINPQFDPVQPFNTCP